MFRLSKDEDLRNPHSYEKIKIRQNTSKVVGFRVSYYVYTMNIMYEKSVFVGDGVELCGNSKREGIRKYSYFHKRQNLTNKVVVEHYDKWWLPS